MNDVEIRNLANAEYYGNKQLATEYRRALQRLEGMIQKKTFEYKDTRTRTEKAWTMQICS